MIRFNNKNAQSEFLNSLTYLNRRSILNVGGERHEILWAYLQRLPNTRLGKLQNAKTIEEILNLCDNYNEVNNEYYFNRMIFWMKLLKMKKQS
jgi:hypothetical protein